MKKFTEVQPPLNASERYLHGICERLEYIAELLESKGIETPVVEEKKVVATRKRTTKKGE